MIRSLFCDNLTFDLVLFLGSSFAKVSEGSDKLFIFIDKGI